MGEVNRVVDGIEEMNVERCAIGGPRESEEPGIERESEEFLHRVWGNMGLVGLRVFRSPS